jgi:transcription initiation factor TFIID TATA-box-binding protein
MAKKKKKTAKRTKTRVFGAQKRKAKRVARPKRKVIKKPKAVRKSTAKEIRVVNIVVSASLGHDIPLEKMAATLSNTEYNPEQFPGLVIRIKEPKTSALIFSSGKIVCTGARTLDMVHDSIKKIIKSLEKINVKIKKVPEFKIQNIVAAGSVGMDLNLNVLAMRLDNTEYEPEQFPGLVYKMPEVKATFLLFSNGKIVCTGTKSEAEVHRALDKLIEKLKKVKPK